MGRGHGTRGGRRHGTRGRRGHNTWGGDTWSLSGGAETARQKIWIPRQVLLRVEAANGTAPVFFRPSAGEKIYAYASNIHKRIEFSPAADLTQRRKTPGSADVVL